MRDRPTPSRLKRRMLSAAMVTVAGIIFVHVAFPQDFAVELFDEVRFVIGIVISCFLSGLFFSDCFGATKSWTVSFVYAFFGLLCATVMAAALTGTIMIPIYGTFVAVGLIATALNPVATPDGLLIWLLLWIVIEIAHRWLAPRYASCGKLSTR